MTKYRTHKYSEDKYISFFKKEKEMLKWSIWLSIIITVGISLFLITSFILPWVGVNDLMDTIPYVCYPIFSIMMASVWVAATFVSINMKSKLKLTDYQLSKSKSTLRIGALLLILPTCGISLFILLSISEEKFKVSDKFDEYWKKHNHKISDKNLYLKDSQPLSSIGAVKLGLTWFIIVIWSLIIIYPIYKLIAVSLNGKVFSTMSSANGYQFSFIHFKNLFAEGVMYKDWFLNTLTIAVVTTIIVIVGSIFSGYVYSRFRFKGKKASLLTIMTLSLIPSTSALAAFYVLNSMLKGVFDVDYKFFLIFLYSSAGVIGNIFILKGYLDTISTEIDEAARVDGCTTFMTYRKIIFPLIKPMIAVVGMGAFAGAFSDYILPALLTTNEKDFTLALGLQKLASDHLEGEFAAGALLIAIPIGGLFIYLQRFLIGGLSKGGVKG